MRYPTFVLIPFLVAACGDDGGPSTGDGEGDTTVLDTTPSGDIPGGDTGGNRAPELERIGDRSVAVGQTLSITLSAKDADSDKLTYSVFGNLPEGARFDKAEHRFEWAPTEPDKTVFLTFVVSDGTDFDRETVRIQVTATATASPPSFADVGDQALKVAEPYELKLVATDPDGDRLNFGHEGTLPSGAALDKTSGVFNWRPAAEAAGQTTRITFTVSDGTASDTLTVNFVVDDGSGTTNKPPVFPQIPPQSAKVGEALSFTLGASDPEGQPVSYTMQREPQGATLNGATFTWTPQQDNGGRTFSVGFSASDGTYSSVMTVEINVSSGQVATCTQDPEEPNEEIASATPLSPGTRTATLCDSATAYDTDVYAVTIPAGQELRAKLTFDGNAGDLDLFLLDAGGTTLASSEGVTAVEELRHGVAGETQAFLFVLGYALEPLAATYTLETSLVAAPQGCSDDAFEDNDSAFDAKPLDASVENGPLQICAGDEDYWTLQVGCGASVEISMDILVATDLDLYLYDQADGLGEPIASAITEDANEFISVPQATRPGTWLLNVSGYPAASAEGGYELISFVSGGCSDDGEAGVSSSSAKPLGPGNGNLQNLAICCRDDWFSFSLQAAEKVIVDLAVSGPGSLGAEVYASDATTQIASKEPSPAGGQVSFTATAAGTYYLKLRGQVGTHYSLDWTVEGAIVGCTDLSCPLYDVCNAATSACVSDFCFEDAECPGGYVCRQTYCVNACFTDDDCRPGYACKNMDDGAAAYCGVTGPGTTGAACDDFAGCEGLLSCLFTDNNGYCAEIGCGICSPGTACATVGNTSFCAKSCETEADCRASDGYTCSPEKTCLPQNP